MTRGEIVALKCNFFLIQICKNVSWRIRNKLDGFKFDGGKVVADGQCVIKCTFLNNSVNSAHDRNVSLEE